jgi:hypothetical protein
MKVKSKIDLDQAQMMSSHVQRYVTLVVVSANENLEKQPWRSSSPSAFSGCISDLDIIMIQHSDNISQPGSRRCSMSNAKT